MIKDSPQILVFDIETSHLEGSMFDIWEQNIPYNNLSVKEWSIIAFSAKWLDDDKMIYFDNRKKRNKRDDKQIVKKLSKLLDKADVVITKNGQKFDVKMFNARCAKHDIDIPSPYRHLDVERIVRRKFKLVSYSLDYLCYYFNTKVKKLKHKNFPGMALWLECISGNIKAWHEMEEYNKADVLSTEEVYHKVKKWDTSIDFSVYSNDYIPVCICGNTHVQKRGYNYSNTGKFQRFICTKCGSWFSSKKNLLTKEKKASLLKKI